MADAQFWDEKFAADSDSGRSLFAGDPNPIIAAHADAAARELDAHSGSGIRRAIDLGSGRGRHTVWLARQGWQTTGMDFSRVGLGDAEAILQAEGLSARLVEGDLTRWDPLSASFELVLSAFIHLPKDSLHAMWQAAGRALSPGGYFVSVSHHPDNEVHGPRDPNVLYTPDEVVESFGAGVDVIEAQNRIADVDGGRMVDTVVVLRKKR